MQALFCGANFNIINQRAPRHYRDNLKHRGNPSYHANLLEQFPRLRLVFIGRPKPGGATEKLIARFDPLFPAESDELNWLLCETLAWLQSPTVAASCEAELSAVMSWPAAIESR